MIAVQSLLKPAIVTHDGDLQLSPEVEKLISGQNTDDLLVTMQAVSNIDVTLQNKPRPWPIYLAKIIENFGNGVKVLDDPDDFCATPDVIEYSLTI